jgi:transcriptional regulator with XRE-family HTH domain
MYWSFDLLDFTEEEFFEFHRQIATNVKKYRISKGISQLDLAIEMGFKNSSFISNVENSKSLAHHYSIEHIYKISKILGVEICELLK